METAGPSLRIVQEISPEQGILLDDGKWYNVRFISVLVDNLGSINVGDDVYKTINGRELRKVLAIAANGYILLDDNSWYVSRYVEAIAE